MFNFIIRQIQHPGKGTITSLSILLSVVLWAILKLNETYFTTLIYPCKIVDIPKGVLLQNNVLPDLTFRVKARGSVLFLEYWRWKKDTLGLKYQNAFNKGYIVLSANQYSFRYFPKDIDIIDFQEDTIPIYLVPSAAVKRVVVRSQVKPVLANGYALFSSPVISPDSVSIFGTKDNIDAISELQTEHIESPLLKEPTTVKVKLKLNPIIKTFHNEINISFSPEKYTEIIQEVQLEVKDVPKDKTIKLFPEVLKINCKIALKEYEKWQNKTWTWAIPYEKLANNELIVPQFDFLPPQVQLNSCPVNQIEYVISEK